MNKTKFKEYSVEELEKLAKSYSDNELKWAIFGQCFQDDVTFLNILNRERNARKNPIYRN